jgi:hypothetical protein
MSCIHLYIRLVRRSADLWGNYQDSKIWGSHGGEDNNAVAPCRLAGKYQCFGDMYCLYIQGRRSRQNVSGLKMETVCFFETLVRIYTASQPSTTTSSSSPAWEQQISHLYFFSVLPSTFWLGLCLADFTLPFTRSFVQVFNMFFNQSPLYNFFLS